MSTASARATTTRRCARPSRRARLLAHSGAEGVNVGREPGAGALALLELLAAGLIQGRSPHHTSCCVWWGRRGPSPSCGCGRRSRRWHWASWRASCSGRAGERRAAVRGGAAAAARRRRAAGGRGARVGTTWPSRSCCARGSRSRCRSSCTCSRCGTSRRPWCCASRAGEGALVLGAAQRLRLQSKPLAEGGVAGGDGALLRATRSESPRTRSRRCARS